MIVGVTGHQDLPAEARDLAHVRLEEIIVQRAASAGVTALARGADQLLAEALIQHQLPFTHIVPCADYGAVFTGDDRLRYEDLAARAASTVYLPFPEPSDAAFLAAGLVLAERSDLVVAVWDGAAARGLGGTADIVSYCRNTSTEVEVVWPPGLSRG